MEEARENFEDQWQNAFEGAEINPPNHVWNTIDATLASKREDGYKKKIIFFKWVAAASVFVAVTSGVLVWVNNFNNTDLVGQQTFEQEVNDEARHASKEEQLLAATREKLENNSVSGTNSNDLSSQKSEESVLKTNNVDSDIENSDGIQNESLFIAEADQEDLKRAVESINEENENARLILAGLDEVGPKSLETNLVPWKAEFLYLVPDLSAARKKKKFDDFDLWAGLSFSSGSFNPGTASSSSGGVSADAAILDFSESGVNAATTSQSSIPTEVGSSYSAGLEVGGMVSEKLILSGGVHYLNMSSNSSSDLLITDPNSNESRALFRRDLSDESLQSSVQDRSLVLSRGSVNFQNEFNYLSLPFKAGYVIYSEKINLIFNSGISTNFLIDNSIRSTNGDISLYDEGSNDDAYKTVFFNMLTSFEVGYRLKEKYYISIEPNYRRALTKFADDDNGLNGKPTSVGLSVGMKYIF